MTNREAALKNLETSIQTNHNRYLELVSYDGGEIKKYYQNHQYYTDAIDGKIDDILQLKKLYYILEYLTEEQFNNSSSWSKKLVDLFFHQVGCYPHETYSYHPDEIAAAEKAAYGM